MIQVPKLGGTMRNLCWLSEDQIPQLRPFFPKGHANLCVDDRRVLIGIIFINRNGLRLRDAPKKYAPAKTLYNRWKRWGDMWVFVWMMEGLASEATVPKRVISTDWPGHGGPEYQIACCH
jgi:transposase